MCKKVETKDECSYGPKIWEIMTLDEEYISEKKRYKVADAILGAAFALSASQSPKNFIRTGHIEAPGVDLMQRWAKTREKAGVDYLDRGRVSHSSRNRKIKSVKEANVSWEQYSVNQPRKDANDRTKFDKNLMMAIIEKIAKEKRRKNYLLNYGYIGEAKTPAWTRKAGKDMVKGGLNRKGIASYRRENPGSKLSMAVTTEPSKLKKGSKSWNRRKSYCSRSAGQMKMWPKAAKDPKSRLRLARKKWNC